MESLHAQAMKEDSNFIEYVTSVSEIYRDNEEYILLVYLYNSIGNYELRDKYIEIALSQNPSDQSICDLRSIKGERI